MCGMRLAENTGRKKVAKNRHLITITQLCRAISSQLRHVSTIGKKLAAICPPHVPIIWWTSATNGWDLLASLGHPCKPKFQRVSRLAFVTAATSLTGGQGQPNFARCMAVWPGTLYIHFRDILPPDGILPRAKFTFCPSMYHRTSFSGYIFSTKASIDNRKKAY